MIDDDVDPVAEILAIREEIMRKYPTSEAYHAHLRTLPSPEALLEQTWKKAGKIRPRRTQDNLSDILDASAPAEAHEDVDPVEEIRAIRNEKNKKPGKPKAPKKPAARRKNTKKLTHA